MAQKSLFLILLLQFFSINICHFLQDIRDTSLSLMDVQKLLHEYTDVYTKLSTDLFRTKEILPSNMMAKALNATFATIYFDVFGVLNYKDHLPLSLILDAVAPAPPSATYGKPRKVNHTLSDENIMLAFCAAIHSIQMHALV